MTNSKKFFHSILFLVWVPVLLNSCSSKNSMNNNEYTKVFEWIADSPSYDPDFPDCNDNLRGVGLCCSIRLDTWVELESGTYYITIKFKDYLYGSEYDNQNQEDIGVKWHLFTHIDEDIFYGNVDEGVSGTLKNAEDGYKVFTSHESWINKGRHNMIIGETYIPVQLANGQKEILTYRLFKKE